MVTDVFTQSGGLDGLEQDRIRQIVDAVGLAPKLATLAMLDRTPSDFVSRTDISHRLDDAQGMNPGWDFSHDSSSTPLYYCKSLLGPLGLVEIGAAPGVKGEEAEGARITPLGSAIWPAIAGAYIPWELDQRDLTLADIIGSSQQALTKGSSLRTDIMQILIDRGSPASITEIHGGVDRSLGTVHGVARELARIGLLSYTSKFQLEDRIFELTDSTETVKSNLHKMLPETRAAFEALLQARQNEGLEHINGLEIINRVKDLHPELDARDVWVEFLDWFTNPHPNKPFVTDITTAPFNGRQSLVDIADSHRVAIKEFIKRRMRLITDKEYRAEAADKGRQAFALKGDTAKLLGNAKRDSKTARIDNIEWELLMLELVPPDGISIDDLLEQVSGQTGKSIQQKPFRKRIASMDDMLEIFEGRHPNGVNYTTYVRMRERVYDKNWVHDARCRRLNIDPDIFSPEEASQYEERRRRLADALFHCARCPVRAPCLRTAVANNGQKDVTIVSGGLSPEQQRKLSKDQRTRLLETITIS